jgi:hypothetical protein
MHGRHGTPCVICALRYMFAIVLCYIFPPNTFVLYGCGLGSDCSWAQHSCRGQRKPSGSEAAGLLGR